MALYSIISSARATKATGTVSPSAFAVLRLINKSRFCGLLDRHIGRFFAFENTSDIGTELFDNPRLDPHHS